MVTCININNNNNNNNFIPTTIDYLQVCSYAGCIKKLNKSEIALRLCKAPPCTTFFIEIGYLGMDNVV